ncbi:hypothetical protein ACEN2Y_00595 (plasmid) [Ralstonia solanacearum]
MKCLRVVPLIAAAAMTLAASMPASAQTTAPACAAATPQQIAGLFDRWNC